MSTFRGNLYGILAILMWSTLIGLMRSVTEAFGVVGGTALLYTVGSLALLSREGLPRLKGAPLVYLLGCGALFVLYSILFPVGIGFAGNARQVMEVGMLNYLWPGLIVAFGVWLNKLQLRWWGWSGLVVSLLGIYVCMSAEHGFDPAGFAANILGNPLPYVLGLVAAVVWGFYCNLSSRFAKGCNGMSLFFISLGLIMWTVFFSRGEALPLPGWEAWLVLAVVGVIYGVSYSLWETGIQHGNLLLLGVLSYFTPIASMVFISLWLRAFPPVVFWAGVGLVIAGSIISWLGSRPGKAKADRLRDSGPLEPCACSA